MKLLVIRHAVAMDREEFAGTGEPDDMRPLTRKGSRKMDEIARGLREEVESIDRIATSPLTRAVETADILADAYGLDGAEVTTSLKPDASPAEFEEWCNTQADSDVVAVVGHEPHLGALVTWLLTGGTVSRIVIKKGGACLLEFDDKPRRDSGTLVWMLSPAQLRKLAG